MTTPSAFVPKMLNYCSILRDDDNLSCGDYVEQGIVGEVEPRLSVVDELSALVHRLYGLMPEEVNIVEVAQEI